MPAQSFPADGSSSVGRSRVRRGGLVQLGWTQFWLLFGGVLSLAGLIIFAAVMATY